MDSVINISGYLLTFGLLGFGIVICFCGYKLFKLSVTVAGVIVGYWAGSFITGLLEKHAGLDPKGIPALIIPLIFAAVFGVLAFSFYQKAFTVVVAALVTRLMISSADYAGLTKNVDLKIKAIIFFACVVVGVIIGVGCYLIQKGAIVFATAFGGATLIRFAVIPYIMKLTGFVDFLTNLAIKVSESNIKPIGAVGGLLVLGFGIAGMIFQFKHNE